jgi:predicted alpha/beta hydrolase family esterase
MKAQVLICHAYKTSPGENWYQDLATKLQQRGYDAKVLHLPFPAAPTEKDWVECIHRHHTRSPLILVGHSLGCRAILAYINQYGVKCEKVFLVACPMLWEGVIETRPALQQYVEGMQPLDFRKLGELIGQLILFHDETDPLLPMKNVVTLENKFKGKVQKYIFKKYGHFDVSEIPELVALF